MSQTNKLELMRYNNLGVGILITIGENCYLSELMSTEEAEGYMRHLCFNDIFSEDPVPEPARVPGIDPEGRIYAECKFCKNRKYFTEFTNIDAIVHDGIAVFLTQPPVVKSIIKEVLQKSETFQESLAEEETLLQFLKRKIRRLFQ